MRLGIDLLGSETSAKQLYEAVLAAQEKLSHEAEFFVFIRKEDLSYVSHEKIQTIISEDIVSMSDSPLSVLRKKKNSSIAQGMNLLKTGEIDAFISSGNTGAIVAAAKTTLKTIKGIQRPALMTLIPAKNKKIAVLDVGANVKCKPSYLVQFASMGVAYQKILGVPLPTVGLLNIGVEEKKGTPEHQLAYAAMQKLNSANKRVFLGNIEGRDVFQGPVDVLITDGFTGNIFLKTSEGMAHFLFEEMHKDLKDRCSCCVEVLEHCKQKMDYAEYPGAILCGVKGIVLKCHGSGRPDSLLHSIDAALDLVRQNFLEKISSELNL